MALTSADLKAQEALMKTIATFLVGKDVLKHLSGATPQCIHIKIPGVPPEVLVEKTGITMVQWGNVQLQFGWRTTLSPEGVVTSRVGKHTLRITPQQPRQLSKTRATRSNTAPRRARSSVEYQQRAHH